MIQLFYQRFMLFEYDDNSEIGGLGDCYFSTDDCEQAKRYASSVIGKNCYIFDRVKGMVIYVRDKK